MIDDFIKNIKRMRSYKKQIVTSKKFLLKKQALANWKNLFQKTSKPAYLIRKINFYSHQAEAINKARQGKNVVIVTPTASGKTLAFNIPVLEALTNDKKATALYLYPTKALTNDQLKVLRELEKETGIKAYPKHLRRRHSSTSKGKHTGKLKNHSNQPLWSPPVPSLAL